MTIKVLELYSGIGGMHFALRESAIEAEVVCALDINTTANEVYRMNFPNHTLREKNIQSLTEQDVNALDVEMILMSPPCQPHTRNGLKRDLLDPRSQSLLHVISLIPKLEKVKYILLENVKGFEVSVIRNILIKVLSESDYSFQEFLLSPNQFCIPNARLRYYLLAKKKPLKLCFERRDVIMEVLPKLDKDVELAVASLNWKYKKLCSGDSCFPLGLILNKENFTLIPENLLLKYGALFDIVTEKSVRSCCFTKGYGHYVEGTGSVLSPKSFDFINNVFSELKEFKEDSNKALSLLKSLELRYFTDEEIGTLMCFPKNFTFPHYFTNKQKFRLLGNSINVHIVGLLIRILAS